MWNLTFERRPVGEVQHLLPIQQNQHNSAPIRPETKWAGVLPKWPKLAQQQACVTILWKTNLFTTCVRINFVTNCVRINLFLSPPLCHTMSGSSRRIKCRKNAHIRVSSVYPNWFSGNLTPKKPCVSVGRSLKSIQKHIYVYHWELVIIATSVMYIRDINCKCNVDCRDGCASQAWIHPIQQQSRGLSQENDQRGSEVQTNGK